MDAATLAELRRRLKDRNAPGYWGVNARAWAKKILREHKNPGGRDSRIRYKSPPLKPCHHCRHKFAGSICPICKTERTDYAALRKNPRDPLHTITASDVGRVTITARGKRWNIVDVMGPIQRIDIGKRIYDMGDGVLQVENDAQRDARLGVRQNPRQDVAFDDTTLNVWEERDRLHIALVDKKTEQKTFAEWWDDDAREMFEDGFFERGKRLHQSVFDYAKEHGLLTPVRAKKNPRNPNGVHFDIDIGSHNVKGGGKTSVNPHGKLRLTPTLSRYCVTKLNGETLECFRTTREAIKWARKYATTHRIKLRIVVAL